MDPITIVFLIAGLALLASEAVAPSLAAGFIGAAALATAILRSIGLVDSIPASLLVWAVSSLALIVPLRPALKRVAGRAEVKKDGTDVEHDRDAMGEIVEVVEDVSEDNDVGRIRFQGTTWQARSTTGAIKSGEKAQLVYREGSLWVIEPVAKDGGARDLFDVDQAQQVEVAAKGRS